MKMTVKSSIIVLLRFISSLVSADENYLFISIDSTIMASDPDDIAETLSNWAGENGGYFTHLSTDRVILRFPWEKAADFRSYLVDVSDEVFSYSSSSSDLREHILSGKSGIEARSEILQKNLELVENADFGGTLYLEQEILRLMSEIEQLKGGLRKAENDREMVYAAIQINFRSHSLPQNIPSSFDWINTLSFTNFIEGPFFDSSGWGSFDIELPEGFALVDKRGVYRAISPEGVRFQVRKGKNYPLKGIDFWSTALMHHLEETGYQRKDEGELIEIGNGNRLFAVEWGLSAGNRDYLYMTAIVPFRKKIYIIEAAGEISAFKN
ncbi:MAG: hypothetical protein GY786_18110, partial [Proteobacteria bacterium]|nr:hypothetical protein [Pseudomonadota bacterium]